MTKYSSEFKVQVVQEYLSGRVSYNTLCAKYSIPSGKPVRGWVKQAQVHGLESLQRKHTKTAYSLKQKLSVVDYYQTSGAGTVSVAAHFGINASQVAAWAKIFRTEGVAGLRPKPRGRRSKMKHREIKASEETGSQRERSRLMVTRGAFGIIVQNQRVLLVKRRDVPLWDLPGGTQQQRETAVDCVVREIREETGLKVQIDYLVGNYFRSLHNDQQTIFKVTALTKKAIASGPETKQIAYFPINRLPKNMVALRRRQILDTFHGKHQLEYTQKECRLSFYAEKIIRRLFKLG